MQLFGEVMMAMPIASNIVTVRFRERMVEASVVETSRK